MKATTSSRPGAKRKLTSDGTTSTATVASSSSSTSHKRQRVDEQQDKENKGSVNQPTSGRATGRSALSQIGNSNVPLASPPPPPPPQSETTAESSSSLIRHISSLSFANMNLEHVPRLSVGCLVHMCQLHMCSTPANNSNNSIRLRAASMLDLVKLITSELFVEFTLNMLEKKLASLEQVRGYLTIDVDRLEYDPECLSDDDLATCLAKLWTCFVQRICGSDTRVPQLTCYRPFFGNAASASSSSSSATANTNAYNMKFFQRTYRYARLSQLIWRYLASTGGMDGERNCDRLVHDERAQYASDDKLLFSFYRAFLSPLHLRSLKVEKDKAIVYWKLVANLVRTVKLHLPPTNNKTPRANQALNEAATVKRDNERLCAAKICGELLELVALVLASHRQPLDILSLVEPRRKHELIQWLYELASHELVSTPTAAAIRLGCTIYELISRLTAQSTTNAHLMKALALDMYKCRISNELTSTFLTFILLYIFR